MPLLLYTAYYCFTLVSLFNQWKVELVSTTLPLIIFLPAVRHAQVASAGSKASGPAAPQNGLYCLPHCQGPNCSSVACKAHKSCGFLATSVLATMLFCRSSCTTTAGHSGHPVMVTSLRCVRECCSVHQMTCRSSM